MQPLVDSPAGAQSPSTPRRQAGPRNPLSAGGWSGLSFIIANAVGGLIYLPLARQLDSHDFGLFAEANLLYLATVLLAETAVVQALVQLRGDQAALARSGLWLGAVLGVVGMCVCILGAPVMVSIFDDRELRALLLTMAPGVLASGLGAVPHALLSRELDFRRKTLPETASIAASGVVALIAAVTGLGVFSLALMALTQATVSTTVAWWVLPVRPRWRRPDGLTTRRVAAFAGTLSAGDMALYARLNTDYALTGKLLGTASLGVYTLAWATSVGPQLFITSFTGRVGYALFARLQYERARLRAVFLAGLRVIAVAAVPVSAGAVLVTPDLVPVALGSKWTEATGPVMVLFALQLVRTLSTPGASLVLATGHSRLYAMVGAMALPATVVAVLAGTRGGVTGVAWGMLVAVGATSFVYLALALRLLRLGAGDLVGALRLPLLITVASAPVIAVTRALLDGPVDAPAGVRLAAAIAAGTVAGLYVLWRAWPSVQPDLHLLRHALPEDSDRPAVPSA